MVDSSQTGRLHTQAKKSNIERKQLLDIFGITCTRINNDFPAIECYTSSSNGIHVITLFSGCCLASGIPGCWVLSLNFASRSPTNLKIKEPEEHFNGCWNEHLFRQQLNFLPLRNFPGALHATHQVVVYCLLSLLHAGSSHLCLHFMADISGVERGVIPIRTASETINSFIHITGFCGFL